MALPISSFWVLRLGPTRGVRNFLVVASARLVPSCPPSAGSRSKVLYSCRTVPPSAQMCGLRTADNDLRAALSQLIGRPLTGDDWRLASLGVAAGGLGARCAAEHAPAAYVASFSASRELCGRLWPAFDPFDLDDGCRLAAAEDALRGAIPSGASIYAVSDSPSQRSLSGMVEAQSVSAIFGDSTLPRHRRLHLEACRVPGAGAWLTANPSCIDSHVSSPLFRVALQHRLRMPLWDRDTACSMYGEVLDRWGDHALACCCGGGGSGLAPQRHPGCGLLRGRRVHVGLSSLRDPPILVVLPSTPTILRLLPRLLLLVVALPTSGFPAACAAPLKPGTSPSRRCFAPLTSLLLPHRLPMSSTKWSPGSGLSRTRLPWLLSAGPPFARLSWRLAGVWWGRGGGGLVPSSSECRRLDCL